MSQFYKKSFYFDETKSRSISIEWNRGYKEVYVSEDGEDLLKEIKVTKFLTGIHIKTKKGENLYIQLYKNPARWEVRIGNRYLVNSYNHAIDSLKSTSNLFYFIFGASVVLFGLRLLILYSEFGNRIFVSDLFLSIDFLLVYIYLIVFFLSAYQLRRGKTIWYFIGTSLYVIDTLLAIVMVFYIGNLSGFSLIVKFIFIYYLIKAYKHVVSLKKHQKEIKKNTDDELLDI